MKHLQIALGTVLFSVYTDATVTMWLTQLLCVYAGVYLVNFAYQVKKAVPQKRSESFDKVFSDV